MAKGSGNCPRCGAIIQADIDPSTIRVMPIRKVTWSIKATCSQCGFRPDTWSVRFPLTIEQLLGLVPEAQDAAQETSTNQS